MGYEVQIRHSTLTIPAVNKPAVFQIWKDLNKPENNHLKNGGSYSNGKKNEHWYSWMDADYDKTCKNCEDILEMLGFYLDVTEDGGIAISGYNSKTGQEDLFIEKAAHLMSGTIDWVGEDGETFSWTVGIEGKLLR